MSGDIPDKTKGSLDAHPPSAPKAEAGCGGRSHALQEGWAGNSKWGLGAGLAYLHHPPTCCATLGQLQNHSAPWLLHFERV